MHEVVLPKLGLTMDEGTIVKWLKQEGEEIQKGEALLELETDKVVMEVEAPEGGVLRRILSEEGSTVPVANIIALIGEADEEIPEKYAEGAVAEPSASEVRGEGSTPAARPEPPAAARPPTRPAGGRAAASPAARRLARELGVDVGAVSGSGPGGRIVDADIRAAAESASAGAAVEVVGAETQVIPLSNIQRTAGQRLTESFRDVPHFYLTIEARADRLHARRQALLPSVEQETGVRLSFTDLFVEAIAASLRRHTRVNASFRNGQVHAHGDVNIAIAMDTEDGLVVPVIHRADTLSIAQIAKRRAELATQARDKKLALDAMQGGTFTLTNLGSFGIDSFIPIINPPQAAILGTGRIAERPIVIGGMLALVPTLMMTISADHRVVDGVAAARFMQDLKEAIEQV